MKKMRSIQFRQHCIFCGGHPISKEHFFGQWMKPFFLDIKQHSQSAVEFRHAIGSDPVVLRTRATRQGSIAARSVKRICILCNTGWMSRLQNLVKNSMLELIQGNSIELSEKEHLALVGWISCLVVNLEYTHPSTVAISEAERLGLYKSQLPPKSWRIYVGQHQSSDWEHRYEHTGICIDENVLTGSISKANNGLSVMTLGKLVLCVATGNDIAELLPEFDGRCFTQIWPDTPNAIKLSELEKWSGDLLDALSQQPIHWANASLPEI